MKNSKIIIAPQQGFSMLEILITLVIVATAMLGTAGLQAHALKTNMGGQYRNQAVFLANDIAERMQANAIDAVAAPGYTTAGAAAPTLNCDAVGGAMCTPAQLRAFDLATWQAAVAAQLPEGVGTIVQTAGNAAANQPATYGITITWVDRASSQTSAGSAVANAGKGENFSLFTTKVISY